jgi:hypothetical protein
LPYEVLKKKIEEPLGQTRRFQEDYRRLENQLQEKKNYLRDKQQRSSN